MPVAGHAQAIDTSKIPKVRIKTIPKNTFVPTCNLDSNSVGFYFFPPNLGAKWTLRTISEVLDVQNNVLKSDTTYSFERVISDSMHTLQGLPVLICESSFPYRLGGEDSVKTQQVEYYVDDSVVMTVFNHSITSELNHVLLENPLDSGRAWKDVADDTTLTTIVATNEPVSTPLGDFPRSLVVQTPAGFAMLYKYFVGGVGMVKIVFRGIAPHTNGGSYVVTSELISLDRGNPNRSIKYRFPKVLQLPKKHRAKKAKQ
ncbi:MAG TPA: hypothetical protein VGM92_04375 [Candidatus Kapabacteria bacterium]